MALINRLENSKFSLPGNGFNPQPGNPDWGHLAKGQSVLVSDRGFSNLHNQYSVYSLDNKENETTMVVKNYNKTPYQSYVPKETRLDPLDGKAPKNTEATTYINKNVSADRNLKGAPGTYSSTGPLEGRY